MKWRPPWLNIYFLFFLLCCFSFFLLFLVHWWTSFISCSFRSTKARFLYAFFGICLCAIVNGCRLSQGTISSSRTVNIAAVFILTCNFVSICVHPLRIESCNVSLLCWLFCYFWCWWITWWIYFFLNLVARYILYIFLISYFGLRLMGLRWTNLSWLLIISLPYCGHTIVVVFSMTL